VKPQNETEIKVIDFGSSCYEHQRGTIHCGIVRVARCPIDMLSPVLYSTQSISVSSRHSSSLTSYCHVGCAVRSCILADMCYYMAEPSDK